MFDIGIWTNTFDGILVCTFLVDNNSYEEGKTEKKQHAKFTIRTDVTKSNAVQKRSLDCLCDSKYNPTICEVYKLGYLLANFFPVSINFFNSSTNFNCLWYIVPFCLSLLFSQQIKRNYLKFVVSDVISLQYCYCETISVLVSF